MNRRGTPSCRVVADCNLQLSGPHAPGGTAQRTTAAVLRMRLVGANARAKVTGLEELPGKSNYFIGNDPKKWRTNVPNYAQGEKH